MWFDDIVKACADRPQLINDSKTPSGRVHVGSLRGVLIHDAIFRALRDAGVEARYTYGIDDFDPMDGLPAEAGEDRRRYMGMPLCNVPSPDPEHGTDMAEYYIGEFLEIFEELGVEAEIYRMRDVYRSGRFNEAIDRILRNAATVRAVYKDISGAERPANWYPFQVICEQCGKIGTTEVIDYDGKEVTYRCRPDLVNWARGCGHTGKVSPFDGHGKLPWKLEWTAKWREFGITIEGAGKDHSTKGGSRDVAAECKRRIFGGGPPYNVPYEFFLVSGAKMSSSKGVGAGARSMADLLPPDVLRHLMIRTPPKRAVNFDTGPEYFTKLFNEYDRFLNAAVKGRPDETHLWKMVRADPTRAPYETVSYPLLVALAQLPHLDIESQIGERFGQGAPISDETRRRIATARLWLHHFATEEDRFELQETWPAAMDTLSQAQNFFLNRLGLHMPKDLGDPEANQSFIFKTARETPLEQPKAFEAIYKALFARDRGPKAGALFAFMDRAFLVERFAGAEYRLADVWRETGKTPDEALEHMRKQAGKITGVTVQPMVLEMDDETLAALELGLDLRGRVMLMRVLVDADSQADATRQGQAFIERFKTLLPEISIGFAGGF